MQYWALRVFYMNLVSNQSQLRKWVVWLYIYFVLKTKKSNWVLDIKSLCITITTNYRVLRVYQALNRLTVLFLHVWTSSFGRLNIFAGKSLWIQVFLKHPIGNRFQSTSFEYFICDNFFYNFLVKVKFYVQKNPELNRNHI